MKKKVAFIILIMASVLYFSEISITEAASLNKGVYEGDQAIDFTLQDINGNSISLSDFKDKTVIVNFFASWCPPCQEEMPAMVELDKRLDKDKYLLLGVNMTKQEKRKEDVIQFMNHFGGKYPVLFDEHGKVMNDYKIIGIPTTLIIDENGLIVKRINGMITLDMIERMLSK